MRTLAILPIKGFDAAKQRLSGLLASGSRHALAQAMFLDVLSSLGRSRGVDAVVVVTCDREAEAAAHGGQVITLPDEAQAGQSAAARIGLRHAVSSGFERALLVPGDTPMMDPTEIDALLDRCERDALDLAVVPDRSGEGTNALVISPPGAFDPSFGPGSFERHLRVAGESGLRHRVEPVPSLAHDVDTPEDLSELASIVEECRGVAPRTRGAIRQLDRWRIAAHMAPAGAPT